MMYPMVAMWAFLYNWWMSIEKGDSLHCIGSPEPARTCQTHQCCNAPVRVRLKA